MRRLLLLTLVACGQPTAKPAAPERRPRREPAVVAPEATEQQRHAAIQEAMHELEVPVHGCWAAAATERFDIAGELTVRIEIKASTAKALVVGDTAKSARLAGCVAQVLSAYRWAPPLHGRTIELPFKFKALAGQSVIDRRLVESKEQDGIAVSVLLDESNTGNDAASMFELRIPPKASTGARLAERAELWYFLTDGQMKSIWSSTVEQLFPAGTLAYVPKGAVRIVTARETELRAVVIIAPGGREARAGALPAPKPTSTQGGAGFHESLLATRYGDVTIYLDPKLIPTTPLSASILTLYTNAKVPEHVHANETEMLYMLEGTGTMTIGGTQIAVTPTSVIQIPKNTKHAFTATGPVRVLTIYTPPGPEQRFKKPSK